MKAEYVLIAAGALALLSWTWMRRGTPSKTVISSPTLGVLNLKGVTSESVIAEDTSAIAANFSRVETSTTNPPWCDVLFLYCDLRTDGCVEGTDRSLSEIVRDSGARVVVVASENSQDGIVATVKKTGNIPSNLAVTLERKGVAFPSFYKRLFASMAQGVTMPVAWVEIVPQIPGEEHADCPSGFFAAGAGQIAFK